MTLLTLLTARECSTEQLAAAGEEVGDDRWVPGQHRDDARNHDERQNVCDVLHFVDPFVLVEVPAICAPVPWFKNPPMTPP